MIYLNPAFKVLSPVEQYTLMQTAGAVRESVDKVDADIYGQFAALTCKAAESNPSDPIGAAEKALAEWWLGYAHHVGATVKYTKSGKAMVTGPQVTPQVRNSWASAKSVLVGALKVADRITVDDGGTPFLRGDGMPRGKAEIQGLITKAKRGDNKQEPDAKSDPLQRALARAADALKIASTLDDDDRDTFLRMLAEQVAKLGSEDDDSDADDEDTLAEAA